MTALTGYIPYQISREDVKAFHNGLLEVPIKLRPLFNIVVSDNLDERFVENRGLGQWSARSSEVSDPAALTGGGEGYSKLYTLIEYYNVKTYSDALHSRNKARGVIAADITEMGRTAAYSLENIMAILLANGFSTTLTADGIALFSASHTRSGAGGTWSNLGTAALSHTSLQAAITALHNRQTSEGLYQMYEPAVLVTGTGLEHTARVVLGSAVTDANMQINPIMGVYPIRHVVSPLLTDANDWMLFAEPGAGGPTMVVRRDAPPSLMYYGPAVNINTTHQYAGRMEFAVGVPMPERCQGYSVT